MNIENMTLKLREALSASDSIASTYNNPVIETEHLFLTLLTQKDGVFSPLFDHLGISKELLEQETTALIQQLPKTYGSQQRTISSALSDVLYRAEKEKENFKDEFISAEHILLAMLESPTKVGALLKRYQVRRDSVMEALKSVRGNNRVTDENPESRYQSLEKYCKDMTLLAKNQKLDPVIGRDEEIRRVYAGPLQKDEE